MAKKFTLLAALFIVFAVGAAEQSLKADAPTTKAPTTAPTTESPGTDVSVPTGAPSTDSVATSTQVPATTESPDACVSSPCHDGSTCEAHFDETFVCLCLLGEFYDDVAQTCRKAKVFPGQLVLPNVPYHPKMENKISEEFKKTSEVIIFELNETFDNVASTVLELRKSETNRVSKESTGTVEASIEIIFMATDEITEKEVQEMLEKKADCENCVLKGSNFTAKDLCDYPQCCDKASTNCKSKNGSFSCSCSSGYIPTDFSDRICLACPSGQQAVGLKCDACSFGRTGFNCEDTRLLTVVIVASVLGGLLLIALIVLPIVAVKMKKKSSKTSKSEDIGKPYVSHSVAKSPLANSSVHNGQLSSYNAPAGGMAANPGVLRFPRATSGGRDNGSNLEMMPGNSRQNLISSGKSSWMNSDEDDKFTFGQSRPQSNYYEQIQSQQNPYAQSRGVNPYAQSQGTSNPYYVPDDDRWSR